jgi:micrococcal nuclease
MADLDCHDDCGSCTFCYGGEMTRIALLLFVLTSSPLHAPDWQGKVVDIADGDTITVLQNGRDQVRIRLLGIDCPEKGQPFGNRAKPMTREFPAGKLEIVKCVDKNHFGRAVTEDPARWEMPN